MSVIVTSLVALTGCSGAGSGPETVTRKEPITRPVSVSGGDRTLTVMVESGGCDMTPRLEASESTTTVALTVRIATRTGPDIACPASALFGPARVVLHTALGSRTVTDATSGRGLPVRGR
ncbi:hypothetical protein [Streptomyces echinatus]|uniref:hypothetical protein n=1 Tax=Streptomyces echinatus TaxID=67293 RepID=UPI0037A87581